MMLYTWPFIDYETKDTYDINEVDEGDIVRYVGTITEINRAGDIYILELDAGVVEAYTRQDDFKEDQVVFVTIYYGDNVTDYDEDNFLVQNIPTTEGYMSLLIIFLGFIVMAMAFIPRQQRVEDAINFVTAPPLEITEQPQGEEGPQQVTCPSCNHVFGVSGTLQRPARITCPKCGTSGIVE
jgi:hypothetical protein